MTATLSRQKAELVLSGAAGEGVFAPAGDWQLSSVAALERSVERLTRSVPRTAVIDLGRIGHIDTSGAWLLQRLARRLEEGGASVRWNNVSENARRLLAAVAMERPTEAVAPPVTARVNPVVGGLAVIGGPVAWLFADLGRWATILGAVVQGVGRGILHPRRFRLTSIVHHLDRTAFRAVPINLVIGFIIGIVIAQQGAFQFASFVGPDIVVVDLTAYLVLREIGVLLTAVMLAGRSGSAITAEIGSMKMREEVDALTVIGLDANEMLAMPRILALVVALPMLAIFLELAALAGGALLCLLYLHMPLGVFIDRAQLTGINTLLSGLIKAPFMALAIGVIATSEGFKVRGSSESLGRHTTASVVKSIFMVILIDGFFAIFFAVIGY